MKLRDRLRLSQASSGLERQDTLLATTGLQGSKAHEDAVGDLAAASTQNDAPFPVH